MKRIVLVILGLIIIGVGGWFAYDKLADDDSNTNQTNAPSTSEQTETPETTQPEQQTESTLSFDNPQKSAHYVSNTPDHGAILDASPGEVVINFNFDLADNSTISITKNGEEHGTGAVNFAADKLSMRRTITDGGNGVYTVYYNACWPDGSCHDGQFQFGVK